MEKRKNSNVPSKSTPLPLDYLKMVNDVFTANFEPGLKKLAALKKKPRLDTNGEIHSDEIRMTVTLSSQEEIAATSVHASCDFDPKASSPTAQDLLGACVDAIGYILGELLNPDQPKQLKSLAEGSIGELENVPLEWTQVELDRFKVFLRVDKTNPRLDQMADDWLAKNDPEFEERNAREQAETEELFVTGARPGKKPGDDTIH